MPGEHVMSDATLGNGVPVKDLAAVPFEVVMSVTGAVLYDVQLLAFVCVSTGDAGNKSRRPTHLLSV